ncbi:Uma2 family endonuclease [Streptomyces sp. A7024]|uniref:Uma2 family endonuclease n=1 Tax=Streptomyces coryli TaxID=1128680 RepID=A0A6G4UEU0_9ACTN|nr:Uma2 family endonuclease [Streptomyces coryli]NGN70198.1 Uma2 family endonuclease [Streptomyces coryli]
MSIEPKPTWPTPPPDGWTADDLDTLPDLPPHTELIDGSLVFVSPQTKFHLRTIRVLDNGLLRTVPADLEVLREFTIVLGKHQRPEPDVIVAKAEADTGPEQTKCAAADVLLAVEVVSPDSVERDRETKPLKYAKAGIPHFWRVESNRGKPVVHVYALDAARDTYHLTGIYHDRLKLSVPYDIDIDLDASR